jgi:3-oxoacyl-[acyl-carrier-protein] synthase-3
MAVMRPQPVSFNIAGSGIYLPRRAVASSEVDALIGAPAGTVEKNFGLTQRYWAAPDETSSFMGAEAARRALADAEWDAQSVDIILGACGVMEQPIPGTSVLIQQKLGLGSRGIPAYDVNATCLSFLMALDMLLDGFALGKWKRGLIVSADIASAALDFSNPEASAIFGDGAAAFAIENGGPLARKAHLLQSFGDGADLCRLEAGGTRLRPHDDLDGFLDRSRFDMDGLGVFKATAKRFPAFLEAFFARAETTPGALDLIIPHQASAPALEHLRRSLPDAHDKTIDIFAAHGNQIATSLAHALHTAHHAGRLKQSRNTLLIGSSAGISLGATLIAC